MSTVTGIVESRSLMNTEKVRTATADVDNLILNRKEVRDVIPDYTDPSDKKIPNSYALFQLYEHLSGLIRQIDPENNVFKDNAVITSPLLPLDFRPDDERWQLKNFFISNYRAIYQGSPLTTDNYLKIDSDYLPDVGRYFLILDISRCDSGRLDLLDYRDNVIKSFNTAERHLLELNVANNEIELFKLVARDVYTNDIIEVRSCGFYHITPRISDYLLFKIAQVTSGGEGGFVTGEQFSAAIAQLTADLKAYVDSRLDEDLGAFLVHINTTGNAHDATPEDIGAADRVHTHTPEECNAAPADHGHTPQEIGAAPEQHTHTPGECGAAPEDHTHTPNQVGLGNIPNALTSEVTVDDATILATAKAVKTVNDKAESALAQVGTKADANHTHTAEEIGAVTPEQVQELVESGIRESVFTVAPMTVVDAPVGVFPQGMNHGSMTPPTNILLQGFIQHHTETHFCYEDGYITATKKTLDTHPLFKAIMKPYTEEQYLSNVAAFESNTTVLDKPVDINYRLHIKRNTTHYTVGVDRSGVIAGKPTKWDVYINEVLTESDVTADWSTGNDLQFPIPELAQVINSLTLVVKEVDLAGTTSWGIRIGLVFNDIAPDQIGIPANLRLAVADNGRTTMVYAGGDIMTVTPTIQREDTPLYVFADVDESSSISTLDVTPIRPEEGVARYGVSVMDGKFSSNIHPVWGTISASNIKVGYDLFPIMNSDDVVWMTEDGISDATITHMFEFETGLAGYTLKFGTADTDPDNIPIGWDLVLILADLSELTIDTVSRFSPAINNGFTSDAYYRKTFDTPVKTIGYRLNLRGNGRGNGIGLKFLDPHLTKDFYSVPAETIYDEEGNSIKRIYLGFAEYLSKPEFGWSGFDVKPTVIGRVALLPINEFGICDYNQVYQIHNPFLTKDVTATIDAVKVSGGGLTPQAEIISLTEEFIQVKVYTEDIFRLRIQRNW